MAYFWGELDFLVGGRLQSVQYRSDRSWPEEDSDLVVLGSFVWLQAGQHVSLEADFLACHVPYPCASLGGVDQDNAPWVLMLQAAPAAIVMDVFGLDANPYDVMRDSLKAALMYNAAASIGPEIELDRVQLLTVFEDYGIEPARVAAWRTRDLIRGLLAQSVDVALERLVAGYPDCAFPEDNHICQHDVFDDVLQAWSSLEPR